MIFFIIVVLVLYFVFSSKINKLNKRIESLEKRYSKETVPEIDTLSKPNQSKEEQTLDSRSALFNNTSSVYEATPHKTSTEEYVIPKKEIKEEDSQKNEWGEERVGKWIGIVGLVAVVIGFGFFIQYAFQNNWIGETGRVALGLLFGVSAVGVSQYLFSRYHSYAQIISALGIVILFLSIYSSFSFYALISPVVATISILAVTVLGAVLSVFNNAKSLAYLSVIGGFVVPLFMDGGVIDSSFILLLTYILIITALGMVTSYFNSAEILAIISSLGGFLIPLLIVSEISSQVFLVYLLIITLFGIIVGQYLKSKSLPMIGVFGGFAIVFLVLINGINVSPLVLLIFLGAVTLSGAVSGLKNTSSDLMFITFSGAVLVPVLLLINSNLEFPLISTYTYILAVSIGAIIISYKNLWRRLDYIALAGVSLLSFILINGEGGSIMLYVQFAFLGAYFLIFTLASFAPSIIKKRSMETADVILSFLTAGLFVGGGLLLLNSFELSMFGGYFVFFISCFYFALTIIVNSLGQNNSVLFLTSLGLGLVTLGVAIPLQLSGAWISLSWTILATVVLYISVKAQSRGIFTFFSLTLILATLRIIFIDAQHYSIDSFTPILNSQFFLLVILATVFAWSALFLYRKTEVWKVLSVTVGVVTFMAVFANILAVGTLTYETVRLYDQKVVAVQKDAAPLIAEYQELELRDRVYEIQNSTRESTNELKNQRGMVVSVLWALYSLILIIVGFIWNIKISRMLGSLFLLITAFKVFIDIWQLGEGIYRIITSIVFGGLALLISFLYAKYKSYIKKNIF